MKTPPVSLGKKFVAAALLAFVAVSAAGAGEPTAFDLIKEGNRYVGEQSKDKVVQIRSERSLGSLTPNVWYVVYYDPDATLKAVEVKFGGGKKLDVSNPLRLLEPITGDAKILDRSKFKVDFDKAIKTATREPVLKAVTVKATQLLLQRGDVGPVWKVKLWAAKLRNPSELADIGEVYVSTEDGKVERTNLHVNSVD